MPSATAQAGASRRLPGVLYMLASALAASSSGLFVRLVDDANAWQILSYRALAFAGLFLAILAWRYRGGLTGAFARIGWLGAGGAVCLGLAYIAYLAAMFLTSIAAAVVVFSVAPILAGVIGAVLLREPPRRDSWVWMVLAMTGVAVMMLWDSEAGRAFAYPRLGMAVALAAAFGYAVAVVILRRTRDRDIRPAFVLAGLFAFAISAPIAGGLAIGLRDAAIGIALGVVSLGLQYLFLERATRFLQAEEVTLLALAEIFIAPLWVWLAIGETPGLKTVLGGACVVGAVVGLALSGRAAARGPLEPDAAGDG